MRGGSGGGKEENASEMENFHVLLMGGGQGEGVQYNVMCCDPSNAGEKCA